MTDAPSPAALIFDWDNTLVNTWPVIHDALNIMLPQFGHEPWELAETKQRVRRSLRDVFPILFGERWQEAQRVYLDAFRAIHLGRLNPMPGAAALIEALAADGRYLALVSNKTGAILRLEVEALGWSRYFSSIVGAGDAVRDKPDRAPVDLALSGSAHRPGRDIWFVGDTGIDMECAVNAGCLPVLVHADAPGSEPGGEFERACPVLHFCDCSDLAHAIFVTPACKMGLL